jgi:cytochrome c553
LAYWDCEATGAKNLCIAGGVALNCVANDYRGFFPIPRIAGQTTEYFENQLRAFVERRRETRSAINMSRTHGLSRETQAALATHFNGLDPRALGGAPRRFVDTGKTIYEAGMPDANVPACSVCHGLKADGKGPIPRLAGQLYPYHKGTGELGQRAGRRRTRHIRRHAANRAQLDHVAN